MGGIGQIDGRLRLDVGSQATDAGTQRGRCPSREKEELWSGGGGRLFLHRRFFEDDVRVRAANAKSADSGATWHAAAFP